MAIILSANGGVIISWEWMNYNVSIAWTLLEKNGSRSAL
jgi:hypothetical protein